MNLIEQVSEAIVNERELTDTPLDDAKTAIRTVAEWCNENIESWGCNTLPSALFRELEKYDEM